MAPLALFGDVALGRRGRVLFDTGWLAAFVAEARVGRQPGATVFAGEPEAGAALNAELRLREIVASTGRAGHFGGGFRGEGSFLHRLHAVARRGN
jgi:hypothetical protein